MGLEVQYLIDQWSRIYQMMAPSPNLFPNLSPKDRQISEFSIASGRREYWDVFVCLMGYCDKTGKDPNEVLRGIPFNRIWEGKIKPWTDEPFLHYCAGWKTVSPESFLPAAYALALALAQKTLVTRPRILERFQECLKLHDGNWPEVWKCLIEG